MADYAGSNTLGTLNGNFKEVYADVIENLIPSDLVITKEVKFVSKQKESGNAYHQPVILGQEHGVTFSGPNSGAFSLNAPIAGQIKDATVNPSQLVLRSAMDYEAAARAAKGRNAFIDATQYLIENMTESISKKLEIEHMYGSSGLAVVESLDSQDIEIKAAHWAPGIWAGSENMKIDVYQGTTNTPRQANLTITAVDMDARVLTVSGTTTDIADGDTIYFKGAKGNEMVGLHGILSNTGSLFGINAADYSLWQSPVVDVSGDTDKTLSFSVAQRAASRAKEKGGSGKYVLLCNVRAFTDLQEDEAALRMYDSSYKPGKLEKGTESLTYHSQVGAMEIVPSLYVKEGFAYFIKIADFSRIGAVDVTFKVPGREEEFFTQLADNAGYDIRCYTDQALFCKAPGRQVLIKGLVNSDD